MTDYSIFNHPGYSIFQQGSEMTKAKTIAINEVTKTKLKALFLNETVVAIVTEGSAKFSNGNSEFITSGQGIPDGTYHVDVKPEDITATAIEPAKPSKTGAVAKATKAIKDAVTPAPRIAKSGSSTYKPSQSMR